MRRRTPHPATAQPPSTGHGARLDLTTRVAYTDGEQQHMPVAANARRLGSGAYDTATGLGTRTVAARRFLEVASMRYPALLEDLARIAVTPEAFGGDALCLPSGDAIVETVWCGERGHWDAVIGAVQRWAAEHRIASPFVMNAALCTLAAWTRDPALRHQRVWVFPGVTWRLPSTSVMPTLPEPLIEDWETALTRWRSLWDARAAELHAGGYRGSGLKDASHFEWLARVQIGRESVRQVAASVHRTRSTVSGAVHHTAALLGLVLPSRTTVRRARTP